MQRRRRKGTVAAMGAVHTVVGRAASLPGTWQACLWQVRVELGVMLLEHCPGRGQGRVTAPKHGGIRLPPPGFMLTSSSLDLRLFWCPSKQDLALHSGPVSGVPISVANVAEVSRPCLV